MGEFRMPSLGAEMEAGTLVEWRVSPGARVERGDVVALVETEKGVVEVEIWESGVIDEIAVPPGTKVPVGTLLARLRGEAAPVRPSPSPPAVPSAPAPPPAKPHPAPSATVRASPAARQLARERGVDLVKVRGTGPHEAVTRADVERAAAEPEAAPVTPSVAFAQGMRRAIASAMARSKREIPHYYLGAELDVSRAVRWLEATNVERPVTERILFAALLVKATALAVRDVPELNGYYVDDAFRPAEGVHVGVAISLRQGGLVAPAIHDADTKPLHEIMARLHDVTARARRGSLKSSELSDPTITVTSLGDLGSDVVFGVIHPPQVALVGFGTVRERPWAENGMLGARPTLAASLSGDHRVSDGHRGARFLASVSRLLNAPEKL